MKEEREGGRKEGGREEGGREGRTLSILVFTVS
jgi:hypothetical protein